MEKKGKPITVEEGRRILTAKQHRAGKPKSGFHLETGLDTAAKLQALRDCELCENLLVETAVCLDGTDGVKVRCRAGICLLDIYRERVYLNADQLSASLPCLSRRQLIKEALNPKGLETAFTAL